MKFTDMEVTNLKIIKKHYAHECRDVCHCYEEGYEWFVNGEFVHRSPCEDSGWLAVLTHLGLNVELVGMDQNGEETWSL